MALIDNLIAYYPLSNGNDVHGTHHFTVVGAAGYEAAKLNNGKVFTNGESGAPADYLYAANNADLSPGAGNHSVQLWVKFTNKQNFGRGITKYGNDGLSVYLIGCNSSGYASVFYRDEGGDSATVTGSTDLADGAWHHIVGTRNGTTVHLYVDGSEIGTGNTNASMGTIDTNDADYRLWLGAYADDNTTTPKPNPNSFIGTIDEVGIWAKALSLAEVQLLYNSGNGLNYPLRESELNSTPLISDAKLVAYYRLEGNSNDETANNNDGTDVGSPTYATSNGVFNKGISLDGSSQGVDLPNLGVSGGTARTVAFWIYFDTITGVRTAFYGGTHTGNGSELGIAFNVIAANDIYIGWNNTDFYTATNAVATGAWKHIAMVYDGGTLSTSTVHVYVNGVSKSLTKTGAATVAADTVDDNYCFGFDTLNAGREIDGSMDDIAIFNRALTPTEIKYLYDGDQLAGVDDAYTKLLLHCNGADASTVFVDEGGHTVTANGNAQIDMAQSKFGGASGLFDGTGDYLSVPDSADWDFGTGDFTVDFWVRFASLPSAGASWNMCFRQTTGAAGTLLRLALVNNPSGTYKLYTTINGTTYTPVWSGVATNTWYHIELSRSGTTLKSFIDGTTFDTQTGVTADMTSDQAFYVIWTEDSLNGWIDEFRLSNGIARHTANFTPPTASYVPPDIFSVNDAVTVSEDVSVVSILNVSVVDSITVTDTASDIAYGPMFDEVTVTEDVVLEIIDGASVSIIDTTTVTEDINLYITELFINDVFDSITVSEDIVLSYSLPSTIFDSIAVSEDIVVFINELIVDVVDSVTVLEDIDLAVDLYIQYIFDSITVSEDIVLSYSLPSPIFDSISVSEDINLYITELFISDIFDSVTVSEDITLSLSLPSPIFDSISVSEDVNVYITELFIDVFDSITISEDVVVRNILYILVWDDITVNDEDEDFIPIYKPLIIENVTVSDVISSTQRLTHTQLFPNLPRATGA